MKWHGIFSGLAAVGLLLIFLSGALSAEDFTISARVVDGTTIRINFDLPDVSNGAELVLYRSTAELTGPDIDKVRYPVTEFLIDPSGDSLSFLDLWAAHNITYHYLASLRPKRGDDILAASNAIEVSTPDIDIEAITELVLHIDKRHYFLELQDAGKTVKRYPVVLGRDPVKRKLHQDNRTTPEGIYRITNLQKQATFYKGIDIDYPNAIDRVRYQFMRSEGLVPDGRGIGGEIQIHGKHFRFGSVQLNWTWGCISLRNDDVDEIFNLAELQVGIPVLIFGDEFTRKDAESLSMERDTDEIKSVQEKLAEMGFYEGQVDGILGRQTRFSIGRHQRDQGLPISCTLDTRTVDSLLVRR